MARGKTIVSRARSENMRAIRSFGNRTTEIHLKALLIQRGISGWKLRDAHVLGAPDFYFPTERLAVFVDGCFWHGCPKCGHIPKTNRAYWRAKIARNQARDRRISRQLRALRFSVIRLRECDLKARKLECLRRIQRALKHRLESDRPFHRGYALRATLAMRSTPRSA